MEYTLFKHRFLLVRQRLNIDEISSFNVSLHLSLLFILLIAILKLTAVINTPTHGIVSVHGGIGEVNNVF